MALITDFDSLKADAALYSWRTGDVAFEDAIDGMIQKAGARLNRKLNLRVMETDAPLTGTPGSRLISLPADFLEPFALRLTTYGDTRKVTPSIAGQMPLHEAASSPEAWCIDGENISLDHPCDEAHTFLFRYRKTLVLSEANPTNWLLTNHPDIYLAAVCVWGGVFILADDEALRFKSILEEGIEELMWQESRSVAIAPLSVDPALVRPGGFNIVTGE